MGSSFLPSRVFPLAILLPLLATAQNATRSEKRGLVYVSTKHSTTDDELLTASWTGLTWYYNYSPYPTSSLNATTLEYVPMLWGASEDSSDKFLDTITQQLSDGANITHVLGFNEPDGERSTGGSSISTDMAAATWMKQIAPLRNDHGLKIGLPAVTGSPRGLKWLTSFNESCEALAEDEGCAADFIPVHWYGNFEGLASYLGQVRAAYPQLPIWVTEFANAHTSLDDAQSFFNMSVEYFDRTDYIERYSYFGSFRSSESNVGQAVAMLNSKGRLTDIGSWYLGGKATGDNPTGAAGCVRSVGTLAAMVQAGIIGFILQMAL